MPRKCSVVGCRSNYPKTGEYVTVYRLPTDQAEKQRWLSAIPRDNMPTSNDTVVCNKHWPADCETVTKKGKIRPASPPTIFPNVPASQIPTAPGKPRNNEMVLLENRAALPDELPQYEAHDSLTYDGIVEFVNTTVSTDTVSFKTDEFVYVQSTMFDSGVPRFVLRINPDLTYVAFHCAVQTTVATLTNNRISRINKRSILEEAVRFLRAQVVTNKQGIILQSLESMRSTGASRKLYGAEIIVRAFEYYAISRSLYTKLVVDYQLPSISTLRRLTSKAAKLDDHQYIQRIFAELEDRQKSCILLIDEICIKPSLLYHGGALFGNAVNKPNALARTVLVMMVKCLFGGPEIVAKVLPVRDLDAAFQYEQATILTDAIREHGGAVVAIVADDNRVNQKFFQNFQTVPDKPWMCADGSTYLLYDYVHVMKCVRNNWLTEKDRQIDYELGGVKYSAKWSDLEDLYNLERNKLVSMSRLNAVAIAPNPIERQKVDTCLRIFCEETLSALRTHPELVDGAVEGTAKFIELFLTFWRIANVRSLHADVRSADPLRSAVHSADSPQLQRLEELTGVAHSMKNIPGKQNKTLTKDTYNAFVHTCSGLVELTKQLLSTSHDFVMLGTFSTDPLEKYFSKLRQSAGGSYYIAAQQVVERVRIDRTKLLLQVDADLSDLTSGHACNLCSRELSEAEAALFDDLECLADSLQTDVKMCLVYIAGYVCRADAENDDDTFAFVEKYGDYLRSIDRGGLRIPGDEICQWCMLCYALFVSLEHPVCRKSLVGFLSDIASYFSIAVTNSHCGIMANVLLSNNAAFVTPYSAREPSQKVLKLG